MKFCDYAESDDIANVMLCLEEDAKKPHSEKIRTEFRALALWHAVENINPGMVNALLEHDRLLPPHLQLEGDDLGRALWKAGERIFDKEKLEKKEVEKKELTKIKTEKNKLKKIKKIIFKYNATAPKNRKIPESFKNLAKRQPIYIPGYLGKIGPPMPSQLEEEEKIEEPTKLKVSWYDKTFTIISKIRFC